MLSPFRISRDDGHRVPFGRGPPAAVGGRVPSQWEPGSLQPPPWGRGREEPVAPGDNSSHAVGSAGRPLETPVSNGPAEGRGTEPTGPLEPPREGPCLGWPLLDPRGRVGGGRSPGWGAGGRAVRLGPALGEQVRWAVLPQRSSLRCAPEAVPPVCRRCQGAVGELQPWLTVPRPAGVTGEWEGGEGGRQVSLNVSSWVLGLQGPWAGARGHCSPSARVLARPQRCLPRWHTLVLPPYSSSHVGLWSQWGN